MSWLELATTVLEALPGFGTFAVAVIVYRSAKSQDAFNRAIAARAAAADEQTLRIALLDRRSAVIQNLRDIGYRFSENGSVDRDLMIAGYDLVAKAELIFDGSVRSELEDLLALFGKWQRQQRVIINAERRGEEERRITALDEQFAIEDDIFNRIPSLPELLRSASAVESLPAAPKA